MADRRPEDQEISRSKRLKTETDPSQNPYLAHMYEDTNKNGYGSQNRNGYDSHNGGTLTSFKRHGTTAEQAHAAEDGPQNPFNGNALSEQYFKILKTRRDLPVHKQR